MRANLGDLTWLPHIATAFEPWRSDGLLPYYLAGVLPFAPATSIKMVFGLALLLGSGGMLLWLSSWLGNPGALVAALVYTYLPYQLATVYVRGAWGETDELSKKIVADPVGVPDFFATICAAVGIDPARNLYDGDRPVPITDRGRPLAALLA